MNKIIVEVGSTCTKIDMFDGEKIKKIKDITIEFKRNYKRENKLNQNDIDTLISEVIKLKEISNNIYVCGTSIFRNLKEKEDNEFFDEFERGTGMKFDVITAEKENELTMLGATKNTNKKVAVFVGGGGSTEIAIYDKKVIETVNTSIGGIDVLNVFPDLSEDFAKTDLEEVKSFIKSKLKLPKEKADILILAGGGHKYFALNSGFRYEENTLYKDEEQPYMMDILTRKEDTEKYYTSMSLDAIKAKTADPNWWNATRAMCAFVLVVAEEIGAKYIVPTDISMIYGMFK